MKGTSLSDHCSVLLARVVCQLEQDVVLVRVISVTDEQLILKGVLKVRTLYTLTLR